MKSWRRLFLWFMVLVLVVSFAVCQKQADKAKTAETPKSAEISSTPEQAEKPAETQPSETPAETKAPAEQQKKAEEPVAAEKKPAAPAQPATQITRDNAAAVIELAKGGSIVIEFFPADAPNTVDNFIKLANKGFYNGLTFHRVVPRFVVQGGDPVGDGTGGPGYTIKAEFNSRSHLTGTVAMARATDPNSAGSQFYICLEPQPGLDGEYTVFGQVIKGMELVKGIVKGDVMKKVTIVDKSNR